MYDDRAGDGARSRLMAAHPQILERSVPFCSPCWRSRHVPGPVDVAPVLGNPGCLSGKLVKQGHELSIEAVAICNMCG